MNGLTFWSIVACYIGSLLGAYQYGKLKGAEATRAHYEWLRRYINRSAA